VREVRRLLDRYLEEIVESYDLCPWAHAARTGEELAVDILWGTPAIEAWVAAAMALLARAGTRVAMVIAPELVVSPAELRAVRHDVANQIKGAGVAEFHPDAPLDHATPARLVPYLRRSPDPMLQLVPHELLAAVRTPQPRAAPLDQIQMIRGGVAPARGDVGDRIAAANHTRVTRDVATLEARLVDIRADRATSYARAGISTSR
jgi:hypothetical protein